MDQPEGRGGGRTESSDHHQQQQRNKPLHTSSGGSVKKRTNFHPNNRAPQQQQQQQQQQPQPPSQQQPQQQPPQQQPSSQQQPSHYNSATGSRRQQQEQQESSKMAAVAPPQAMIPSTHHDLDYHHHHHYPATSAAAQQQQQQQQSSSNTASSGFTMHHHRSQPPPGGNSQQTYASATATTAPHHPQQQQQQQQSQSQPYGVIPQQHSHYQQQQPLPQVVSMQRQHYPAPQQQPQHHYTATNQSQQQPPHHHHAPPPITFVNPGVGRPTQERPIVRLSVSLIETYQRINRVYYEEREARRAARNQQQQQQQDLQQRGNGPNNNGWDDELHDYIWTRNEIFNGKYIIRERIGRGSFGQVVRATDVNTKQDVAIKIIKNRSPFLIQARTEINLLVHLREQDPDDQHNIVRLLEHFMFRNHQCLVFEMLHLNLYELLKNTQFGGVSLNLIRKFGTSILTSLQFLARDNVDIIHCDLKPENILLKHPKRSGVKVIDFGSSCRSNMRMYTYIQSRFYRSPEVMLGLPYSVAIDMWSLGCILVEMHTGEPLFSGTNQVDQMQKIVKILGIIPNDMLERATEQHRTEFFVRQSRHDREEWALRQTEDQEIPVVPSSNALASLLEVARGNPNNKTSTEPATALIYDMFVDLIYKMLQYRPEERIRPEEALQHPFITAIDSRPRH